MSADRPKYPGVVVKLTGHDGNAFSILGRVMKSMRAYGVSKQLCDEFHAEATSGDYDHLLRTCSRWVQVR